MGQHASHFTRPGRVVAYLVILDGEQHEALRVLLQEGLVGLLGLDGRGHGGLWPLLVRGSLLVVGVHLGLEGGEVRVKRRVLLVGGGEVELLDGGLHLKGLDRGSSLQGATLG
jgi:hypothetical protein